MTPARRARLASHERRYRDLARQLSEIGWIASGSVASRTSRCGKDYCACATDAERRHGPYWHFSAKVDGKTVNKRLTDEEAHLYQEWIANDRTVRALLGEMRAIAAEAQALILAEVAPDAAPHEQGTASPETRSPSSRHRSTSS